MASLSRQLLEWMVKQAKPLTSRDSRLAFGWTRKQANTAMNSLHRCGFVRMITSGGKHPEYIPTGKTYKPDVTAEERREKQRGYARTYSAKKRAERGATKRRRLTDEGRLAAMAAKQAAHNRRRRESVATSRKVREASVSQAAARPLRYDPPKPREAAPESVEQFRARGGRVEVLPTHWQAPLRYGRYAGADALF